MNSIQKEGKAREVRAELEQSVKDAMQHAIDCEAKADEEHQKVLQLRREQDSRELIYHSLIVFVYHREHDSDKSGYHSSLSGFRVSLRAFLWCMIRIKNFQMMLNPSHVAESTTLLR